MSMNNPGSTLDSEPVVTTLSRLRTAAGNDWKTMLRMAPLFFKTMMAGKSVMKAVPPARVKNVYMPVSPEQGRFLYAMARAIGARNVVEFGSSFGISTIYLAAALKDNGGGTVISTEIESTKCRAATENIRAAGLEEYVKLLEGDALNTLSNVTGPIDMLFLDGWKDLYLPIFDMLRSRLRPGAVIIGDNVRFPDARPYVERVRTTPHEITSVSLFNDRLEFSCLTG